MKKKILSCTLLGIPVGLALWVAFTVLGSYLRGAGEYNVAAYYLIRVYGNELNAVAAQCVGAMLIGVLWTNAALIWREMDWSLLKQTVVHFFACTVPSLLIAYAMQFMPRSLDGLVQYLTLFGGIYVLNWIVQYLGMRRRVRQINEKLKNMENE